MKGWRLVLGHLRGREQQGTPACVIHVDVCHMHMYGCYGSRKLHVVDNIFFQEANAGPSYHFWGTQIWNQALLAQKAHVPAPGLLR